MVKMKATEKIEIKSHGAHHMALRRKSVNVFEGAINVLTMREPSDSGAASGAGDDATGGRGAAVMSASWQRFEGILAGVWRQDKRPQGFRELHGRRVTKRTSASQFQ